MRIRKRVLALWLIPFLLASCVRDAQPELELAEPAQATSGLPTPTLLPGLPTSTPWTGQLGNTSASRVIEATATPAEPTPTPTATPRPSERLLLAESNLENEDYEAAAEHYQVGLLSDELNDEQRREALLGLGQARLAQGQHSAADEALGQLLADAGDKVSGGNLGSDTGVSEGDEGALEIAKAHFLQAQSLADRGDCGAAIRAYQAYLDVDDTLTGYVQMRIGECHLALGEQEQAAGAFVAAVESESLPEVEIARRYRLAQLYLEMGDFGAAIDQYEAVLAIAQRENTLGEATYLAGTAELLAGQPDAAYARYLEGVMQYPTAYESYLSLVALIEAGYDIDDYQRGVVDYHAEAYEAAVAALSRYLESQDEHEEDAHLYLAWSLEGLGDVPAALEQIEVYIEAYTPSSSSVISPTAVSPQATPQVGGPADQLATNAAARGTLEKAKLLARSGRTSEAAETYREYVMLFPGEEGGPFAAWWGAALMERAGDVERAIEGYLLLAELYPEHEDADEALFRAGWLANESGDEEAARKIWKDTALQYPNDDYGAAALVWLTRMATGDELEDLLAEAGEREGSGFYPLRAQHIASETAPFEVVEEYDLKLTDEDQAETEAWLREQLALPSEVDLDALSQELADDGRLRRGQALWRLGQRQDAKTELESLRRQYADDPLASYRLALFFRELGLYRSSILAAAAVMNEIGVDVFSAPYYLAGLAYPTYYSELITAEAEHYGYDPLLQFALVRQESLFESFARSGAAAQGLSQVIPDTGAYIAQRLGLLDYVNEDLYKPYVGIAFGAYYLDQQLDAFDGNVAAALSAYNAGPGNAARWYGAAGGDIDLYVEIVDFSETRQYIKRIYSGQAIYRHLYGE